VAVHERTEADVAPAKVGIVGAGQLARMLCEAASALGLATVVLAADRSDAAVSVAGDVRLGSATDPGALRGLAEACDVVTFDHELVGLEALKVLESAGIAVRPSTDALVLAVDKSVQRRRFAAAGLPVPPFVVLDGDRAADRAALVAFADQIEGAPVVKAARGGYDGRGVVVAESLDESLEAAAAWRDAGVEVVAEARIEFRAELAALLVRRPGGETASWRTVRTTQVDGVCREVCVPGGLDDAFDEAAARLAHRVADVAGAVGVLAVELFDTADGLLVNEVALRPHNSGHWTIEGSTTSQFENHLRAVLDLPLGDTSMRATAVTTVNVFGSTGPIDEALAHALEEPTAKVHLYGKSSRPGRKLGHVTVLGDDGDDVTARAWRAAAALGTPVTTQMGAK
jgi:5-(carboxyamino)imidazole ribonucleotide synthase